MSEIKLKPCPFCGGEVVLRKTHTLGDIYFFVMCSVCNKATNAFPLEEEAAEAWNKRAELPSAQPEIITCIDCIYYTPFGEDKECGRCSVNQRMCQSCNFCAWAERREEDGREAIG